MKAAILAALLTAAPLAAHAEYQQVNLTVFGMDCAPCAHAIRVSMKGIHGVQNVDVDLNTGLVAVKLAPGNSAAMREFNQAVEKNGFTHKDAQVTLRGQLSGTPDAPVLTVTGTADRYTLSSASSLTPLIGKQVTVQGVVPQAPKGKLADTLRVTTVSEVR